MAAGPVLGLCEVQQEKLSAKMPLLSPRASWELDG